MEFKHTIDKHTFVITVKDSVYEQLVKFCPVDFDPNTAEDCLCCQGNEDEWDCELRGLYDMSRSDHSTTIHCHEAMKNLKDFYLQCRVYIDSLKDPETIKGIVENFSKKKNGTLYKNRTYYPVVCNNGTLYEDSYCYYSEALKWKVDSDLTAYLSFDGFSHTW